METQAHEQGALNIEQEYINTLRRRSNLLFLSENQLSVEEIEDLLQPQQDLLLQALRNMVTDWRSSTGIKRAMAGYSDASADASEICKKLLRNIKNTQSNYKSMDSFLTSIAESTTDASTSAPGAPRPFPSGGNPFGTRARSSFKRIHDKYSLVLHNIRSNHKKVARKHKMLKAVKKLCWTCLVMACCAAAIGLATHLASVGVLVGPVAARLIVPMALKTSRLTARTTKKKRCSKSRTRSLRRLQEQLDTAAKGTYVLGRDLDTVSQLVERLSDGIDRENAMASHCVERMGERSSVLEMAGELRRSCASTLRLAEELEEHVCLCLATVHRARVLVIQEFSKQA
ncbi:hypothetical protein ACP4OV_031926 [Aristida adscensionis]